LFQGTRNHLLILVGAGEVRCVVNGELYGYRAIRSASQTDGRHFATDSDSEIALHLYEQLGGDFVHQLHGEFAVVIADQRRRRLIAVRDRFGIKPLFYTVRGGDVLVASEIKALLALGVPARWDAAAFFAECHNIRTADRTLFGDVLTVFCQDTLRSRSVEDQPFFDPCRVRGLMDQVAVMEPADRAAFQGVVLGIVSTCILQQRFGLAS